MNYRIHFTFTRTASFPTAWFRVCLLLALMAAGLSPAGAALLAQDSRQLDIESFEYVWKTIRDKHWDPTLGGLDWQAVHDEFRPRVEQSKSSDEARALISEMLSRLGQSHFSIIPSTVYRDMGSETPESGDYPAGIGETGIDVRVIDGRALVTRVDDPSPAASRQVGLGWEILQVRGRPLAPVIRRIDQAYRSSTLRDFHLRRAVLSRLSGNIGDRIPMVFLDCSDREAALDVPLARPRGNRTVFGYLGPQFVWFESRKLDRNIGYMSFNLFLDPANLAREFGEAVQSCLRCAGIMIDLRGNPGGMGAMSMGMAGWFISAPDQRLGTMFTRSVPLKFTVNPRVQTYGGPLAILLDGSSVSTSEIFAGGLKDLGRARIFGTRSAGAALPSVFERLPNGDGFQYAVANYISEGGKPLEGAGVTPDEEVAPTRAALLQGRDPVLEAAKAWIEKQQAARATPRDEP